MKHDPIFQGKRWLDQAERDLDDARYALAGDRFNLACFLSQQCAEKAIRLFSLGEVLKRSGGIPSRNCARTRLY